jgi:excisionase family DNA binding protein
VEHQATTHADEMALLTPRQAAERLKCSMNHIYRLIAQGELRAVDIARAGSRRTKMRVRSDDLALYVDSRTPGPAS